MFRTFLFILVSVFLLAGCSSSNRTAICFYSSAIERAVLPIISFDAVNFIVEGKPRLDVLFQIPLKNLKFQKAVNTFTATYTVTVRVLDTDEKSVATQEWSKKVTVNDYRRTISGESDVTLRMFFIPPGKYTLVVTILDEQSQQRREEQKEVNVRPAGGSLEASDIVLLQKITMEEGIRTITPILPTDIGKVRSFSTFMEVYDSIKTDTLQVNTRIIPFHIDYDLYRQSSPYTNQSYVFPKDLFAPKFDAELLRSDTIVMTEGPPVQLFHTYAVPPPGRYQLLAEVTKKKTDKSDSLLIGRILTVHSEYFPDVVDIDDLIDPLQYIVKSDEYDSLRAPVKKEERARRLEEYWNTKLDPVLRQDFYTRVRQANEYFTGVIDGWRTPMGMVYIVAGPPADLECQSGMSETWYYDFQQGYAMFVFQTSSVAQSGDRPIFTLTGYPPENVWSTFIYRWHR